MLAFKAAAGSELLQEFNTFQQVKASWLDDFALFMALKEANGGGSWVNWSHALRSRDPKALEKARQEYADAI